MAKHLNPLEKEFLIRKFKSNPRIKLSDFCQANNVSVTAFKKWLLYAEVTFYFDVFTKEMLTFRVADRRGDRMQYIDGLEDVRKLLAGRTERKDTFNQRTLDPLPKFVRERKKKTESQQLGKYFYF